MATSDVVKNQSAKRPSRPVPKALAATYDRRSGRIVVELSSGVQVSFVAVEAQGLEQARPSQLDAIEITPSGLGLHFPEVDADIYIPGLLEGALGTRKWMAAHMGRAGGRSQSRRKIAAARENGKLGGRPKKTAKA